jgi:hypothetical protein
LRPVKLIRLYLNQRWVWPVRLASLAISIPFVLKIYTALLTGIAVSNQVTSIQGEHWGFYAYVFKYSAFSFLFIWLGTFGTQEKRNKSGI